jgi:peptidoglycan/xylan/chitin deacetylase (PgdA/CDA1 family)
VTVARYDYEPIVDRPRLLWPDGAAVALWIIPNVEYYPFGNSGPAINQAAAASSPDVLNSSWRDYGVRVGFWRLLDCLDEVGVKVSATLNSEVCDQYPQLVAAGLERGWEWIGHGANNTVRMTDMEEDEELAHVRQATERLTEATGRAPSGWLGPSLSESWNTPDILLRCGYSYVCDWVCDDLPVRLRADGGSLVAMPYSIELNDMQLVFRERRTGPEYLRSLTDHFDQLRADAKREGRGRVMAVPLHPFLMGQARYVPYLREALQQITRSGDAWSATGAEICNYYMDATS